MDLILMGVIGYVAFLGIIALIVSVKANECGCGRNDYGHCKC